MANGKVLSQEVIQRIKTLLASGKKPNQIARIVNRPKTTIWHFLIRHQLHQTSQKRTQKVEKKECEFFNEHERENWLI